jgi:hypothetical protein
MVDAVRYAGIIWRENILRPKQQTGEGGHYHTFNEWHLGDNLIHLNFLRRLALQHPDFEFTHACRKEYHEQLQPLVWPLTNVKIVPLEGRNPNGIDAWKNHGAFTLRGGYASHSPLMLDWAKFHIEFFAELARRMGLATPIKSCDDLLFDYPGLSDETPLRDHWDVLVCNTGGFSRQLRGWKEDDWDDLIERLLKAGRKVVCTQRSRARAPSTMELGLSVTGVGNVSTHADRIIGCPCGPMWPTFNIWNRNAPRIVVLSKETVALGTQTKHARNKSDVLAIMEGDGWF